MTVIDFDAYRKSRATRDAERARVREVLTGVTPVAEDPSCERIDAVLAQLRADIAADERQFSRIAAVRRPSNPVPIDPVRRQADMRAALADLTSRAMQDAASLTALLSDVDRRIAFGQSLKPALLRSIYNTLARRRNDDDRVVDLESRCGVSAQLLSGALVELANGDIVDAIEVGGDAA